MLDPNIIEWIKERTAKEQDGRLDFNAKKIGLVDVEQKMKFTIDI